MRCLTGFTDERYLAKLMLHHPFEITIQETIDEDTAFKDDLRLDSFEMMEFVMALEEEYGVGFSDEEVAELETVGDMMDAINEKGIELD